jgi:hypothetical protein
MRRIRVIAVSESLLAGVTIILQSAMAQEPPGPPAAPAAVVCSTLEVKTAERLGIALATFHQTNKSDGPRLGELLRQNDGVSVEFETSDRRTHTAILFRFGTCFGRGLLVFPAGSVRLTPREQFRLRFPQRSKSG